MKLLAHFPFLPFLLGLTALLTACGPATPAPITPTSVPQMTATPAPMEATMTPETSELPTTEPSGDDLDLRFANVIRVEFEKMSENEFRFNVTLFHDDDGEAPNFADAWQVEDLEGNVLGKRELLHSHGTQPFTRSQTITIPSGIETVLVKGHDMTHGFGGQAMRVDLNTGVTTPISLDG